MRTLYWICFGMICACICTFILIDFRATISEYARLAFSAAGALLCFYYGGKSAGTGRLKKPGVGRIYQVLGSQLFCDPERGYHVLLLQECVKEMVNEDKQTGEWTTILDKVGTPLFFETGESQGGSKLVRRTKGGWRKFPDKGGHKFLDDPPAVPIPT